MSNEKQTDSFHWKNKLEALDSLPDGFISDKNAAWAKLYDRLHEKPNRSKVVWYWAAACLLPVLVLLWIATNKKESIIMKANLQQPKNKTTPGLRLPLDQKEKIPVSPSISIEQNPAIKNIAHPRKSTAAGKEIYTRMDKPFISNTIIETIPEAAINTIRPADTAAAITTIAVVKKQLRVVHINELEKQELENAPLASQHQWPSFQIKFLNHNIYSGISLPEGKTEQDILTIKIPLKN